MAVAQARRTHCPRNHPLSGPNVCRTGGRRVCLQCQRDARRAAQPPRTITEAVWARIERQADGCWWWVGAMHSEGYGSYGRTPHMLAHRLVYELLVEPIPEAYVLDHLCRVRRCVNPSHLEIVTLAENVRRGAADRKAGR